MTIDDFRKKEGELHNYKTKEKFFGVWDQDKHGDAAVSSPASPRYHTFLSIKNKKTKTKQNNKQNKQRSGYGVMTNVSKEKYYGDWKGDVFNGQGVYFYNDGTYFVGGFLKGKKDGLGTMFFANGDSVEGVWTDNSIQKGTFKKGDWTDSSEQVLLFLKKKQPFLCFI